MKSINWHPWPIGCLAISLILGCDSVPPRPEVTQHDASRNAAAVEAEEPESWNAAENNETVEQLKAAYRTVGKPLEEYWEEYQIAGRKAGFNHTLIEILAEPDGEYDRRVSFSDRLRVQRGNEVLQQEFEQVSIESRRGKIKRFSASLRVGDQETRFTGRVEDDRLLLVTAQGGEETTRALPLPKDARGSLAVSHSLRNRPMTKDETRTLNVLLPIQYVFARVELSAIGSMTVPLADQSSAELLEIESVTYVGDEEFMQQTYWIDDEGEILKTYAPAFDLVSLRTTEHEATLDSGELVDLLAATRVPLSQRIPIGQDQVRLRVRHENVAPEKIIPTTEYQRVTSTGNLTAEIEIHREPVGRSREPGSGDLEPSALIQSDDGQIVAFAKREAEACQANLLDCLRDAVHNIVIIKDFSRGFATASEVVREPVGDCTEHSVLLAAACRAQGIPAQVAAGLVQTETRDGMAMAYHMWTLAWDREQKQWVILDGTFGKVPVGTDRIEIVRTDLSSGNPYEALMPVLRTIGQISIDVLP